MDFVEKFKNSKLFKNQHWDDIKEQIKKDKKKQKKSRLKKRIKSRKKRKRYYEKCNCNKENKNK